MNIESGVPPSPNTSSVRILVVEDDPSLSSTLCYNLRREGYSPIAAADGKTAFDYLKANRDQVDLVLLDVMLPAMPGLQVLRGMRQFSTAPVLILSARGQEQDKIDGLDLGADDYLVKPFALRELMARIRALLRSRPSRPDHVPSVINRGALQIETSARRVLVQGDELLLRPKEFGLLVTLAANPDKVFSRQELLDAVWGEEIVVDERTVDVHVSWLRTKLRQAGLNEEVIRTAYGVGYRFSAMSPGADQHTESLRFEGGDVQTGQAAGLGTR